MKSYDYHLSVTKNVYTYYELDSTSHLSLVLLLDAPYLTLELQRNFLSLGSARPLLLLLKEFSLFRDLEHLIMVILMQLAISQFTNRY